MFEWINANGPAANLEASFARFEIIETLALVPLEATRWSGKLVGTTNLASDDFSLFKLNGAWKITHKLFHWHTD